MQTILSTIANAHDSFKPILNLAIQKVDNQYLQELDEDQTWLPGVDKIFNAFSVDLYNIKYILIGESPYPRRLSANGYAFWDGDVDDLWCEDGLSKKVNRATSLRNFIKMLLNAKGELDVDFSKSAIAKLDKSIYVQKGSELFDNMLDKGFLLLNASLVYSEGKVNYHAKNWQRFMLETLKQIKIARPHVKLILFGKIAKHFEGIGDFSKLISEHPYNISFINNPKVVEFFKPLDLLVAK